MIFDKRFVVPVVAIIAYLGLLFSGAVLPPQNGDWNHGVPLFAQIATLVFYQVVTCSLYAWLPRHKCGAIAAYLTIGGLAVSGVSFPQGGPIWISVGDFGMFMTLVGSLLGIFLIVASLLKPSGPFLVRRRVA